MHNFVQLLFIRNNNSDIYGNSAQKNDTKKMLSRWDTGIESGLTGMYLYILIGGDLILLLLDILGNSHIMLTDSKLN